MDLIIFLGVFAFSIFAGAFGALMGLGGGLIIVPILAVIFGFDVKTAIAASIVAVIATSCAGASVYCDRRQVNIKLGIVLETATAVGAITGALLTAVLLPKKIIMAFFIGALVYAAVYMALRPERLIKPGRRKGRLCGSYTDDKTGKKVEYDVRHVKGGLIAGFFAGNMSGMLGVGGGLVQVPVMNGWMRVPIKAAIATSNFMIGVTAVASAYIYYTHDYFYPVLAAFVAAGVFFGARGGSLAASRFDAKRLRSLFIAVIIIMAFLMMLRLIGVVNPI